MGRVVGVGVAAFFAFVVVFQTLVASEYAAGTFYTVLVWVAFGGVFASIIGGVWAYAWVAEWWKDFRRGGG